MITRRTALASLGGLFFGVKHLPEVVAQVQREIQRESPLDAINRITLEVLRAHSEDIIDNIFARSPFFAMMNKTYRGNFYLTDSGEWRRYFRPGPLRLDPARLPA